MRTHPLWNPFETPSGDEIGAARVRVDVSSPVPALALVEVVAPDPAWPHLYAVARDRLVDALWERALAIEHMGSTSVPGLPAKPTIDIDSPLPTPATRTHGCRRSRGWASC